MKSAASSDAFVGVCASVESTLAGVGVDVGSGPVVIHLLMCVLVLNQHYLVLMLMLVVVQ